MNNKNIMNTKKKLIMMIKSIENKIKKKKRKIIKSIKNKIIKYKINYDY